MYASSEKKTKATFTGGLSLSPATLSLYAEISRAKGGL